MSETTPRKASHERYQFTWSTKATPTGAAAVSVPQGYSSDYVPEASVVDVENDGAGEAPEQIGQISQTPTEDEVNLASVYHSLDDGSFRTFRSSPKSNGRFGSTSGPVSFRFKLGALAGWSCVAAGGAAFLLANSGALASVRLAELGAVWAAISALVWFLPGKLMK